MVKSVKPIKVSKVRFSMWGDNRFRMRVGNKWQAFDRLAECRQLAESKKRAIQVILN